MTIAPGVNMITKQMTPFFSLNSTTLVFELYPLVYFVFDFYGQWGLPSALCSDLYNTHLHAKDDTFKPVNRDILFLYKS